MNKKILVTGGAGYIGSHTLLSLISEGYEVISIDNFSNSTDENFKAINTLTETSVQNYNIDLCDKIAVEKVFEEHRDIYGIIHFAAYKYVGESAREPLKYFENNINSLLSILHCQVKYEVKNLIFSSSCTVYGNPDKLPVDEKCPIKPAESPYGRTKQICENIIEDAVQNNLDLKCIILRYFNPAGIDKSGLLRETTTKRQETLVPILKEVLDGARSSIDVFGNDYDTRDGTPIRDYIHVSDLADAHTKSLKYLLKVDKSPFVDYFNIGLGNGVTVKEMINAAEKTSQKKIAHTYTGRRIGDMAATYADISKAKKELKWSPKFDIGDIFKSILE